jgi:hypothetical protein
LTLKNLATPPKKLAKKAKKKKAQSTPFAKLKMIPQ